MTLSKFNVSQLVFQGFSTSRSLYKDRVPLWPLVQEASVAWPFEVLGYAWEVNKVRKKQTIKQEIRKTIFK